MVEFIEYKKNWLNLYKKIIYSYNVFLTFEITHFPSNYTYNWVNREREREKKLIMIR